MIKIVSKIALASVSVISYAGMPKIAAKRSTASSPSFTLKRSLLNYYKCNALDDSGGGMTAPSRVAAKDGDEAIALFVLKVMNEKRTGGALRLDGDGDGGHKDVSDVECTYLKSATDPN